MMGPDCERIAAGIEAVKDALIAAIKSLADNSAYRISTVGEHGESETSNSAGGFMTSPKTIMDDLLLPDIIKMDALAAGHFTSVKSWNNSYGSPWTELDNLRDAIDDALAADSVSFMGDRLKLLALMHIAVERAIDAKYAMIQYNDYVQRGYDNIYNGNTPSITTKTQIGEVTTGNVKQNYNENVNVPKPNYDPW